MKLLIFTVLFSVVYSDIIKSDENTFSVKLGDTKADWWKKSIIYQIYPRSFKDSDNDGIGDLQGIIQKLNYFVDLGVDAIWLSPIYQSPMVDAGYDISDYRAIAPEYGTLDDFLVLLTKAHDLGLKVILDFVPNHTSDLHVWFNKSASREPGYEDYYVWGDAVVDSDGNKSPPNNWISLWQNSGWEWNEVRQQYYFHQFAKQQPDLNFRSEKVLQELKDVMSYWLDLGVDGFRVDAVPHIYEDAQLRDEPINPDSGVGPDSYNYLQHIYTKDQPETFELIYNWREFLDNYTNTAGGDTRIFMTESATDIEKIVKYYGDETRSGAHLSFNFYLIGMTNTTTALEMFNAVKAWYFTLNTTKYTLNWLVGNHDNPRVASRVGAQNIDGFNMLITFLNGVTISYMGEEIGQENGEVTCEEGQDPSAIGNCSTFAQVSRDFERTPFQWDTTVNAGFNDGAKPWLPVSSKYFETNLANEKAVENSHYHIYKKLVNMKRVLDGYNSITVACVGNRTISASRYSDDADDKTYFEFFYHVDGDSYEVSTLNSTVVAQSVNVDYKSGDSIVLKPGDSVILKVTRS